ncbi:nuclear autoantigenic sperm protein isoform X2 [Nematostella vectensis]|uniref:nuclear autoantigenic sperm protein isoform X2 n=1 Tax=Nematostella vectensis TaxID=45351 RepID=UPI002076E44E|nr:nuclear autoantigenic sperm protein isoform X2 [Nematostella vectensis]
MASTEKQTPSNVEQEAISDETFDEEIAKLMGKGKRHFICSEILDAVKCLEEATKRLDKRYGKTNEDKCGEAYLWYGKALFELARMEGGVLGNALQDAIDEKGDQNGEESESTNGAPSDKKTDEQEVDSKEEKDELIVGPKISEIPEEEKEQIGTEVVEAMTREAFDKAMEEDKKKDAKSDEKPTKGESSKSEEKPADDKKASEEAAGDENKDELMEGEEEEEEEEEEEGDDDEDKADEGADEASDKDEPTYMELAWQVFELARLIFEKRDSKEGKLLLAQCHLKLGEIQMEQEQFMPAIDDFLKCLDIQKEHLEEDNRLLAETAYNIGLSFSFQSMHDKAKKYYSQALEVLEKRMNCLQKSIDEADSKSKGKGKADDEDPTVKNRKELEELQDLFPEIKAKVDEASDLMTQTKPDVASIMSNGATTTVGFGASSSDAPTKATLIAIKKAPVAATDISHLVHRNKVGAAQHVVCSPEETRRR